MTGCTRRLRVLVLAPDCNPEMVSIPLVSYCHAAALAELHDVTVVVQERVEAPVRRAKAPFHAIEVVRMPGLQRIFDWCFKTVLRSNYDTQALTALAYPFSVAFEWFAWRQLRDRIFAREFDVVLRVLPISPTLSGPFSRFLRKGPVPFVVGPVNGGLPWPSGFSQLKRQRQWISGLRGLYKYLPFSRSTYRCAAAIIAASSQTWTEFSAYREKLFFIPENGVSAALFSEAPRGSTGSGKLELLFVGGLVPRKACDLALRAAASLLKGDRARFTILGDGPERGRLEQLAESLGIADRVCFRGWVNHDDVMNHMRCSDVFVFPSVRDFGGGVVFEALGAGAVPVVVDFGGAADIVHPEVGFKVAATNEDEVVADIEEVLANLARDHDLLERLRWQGISYARERLTWEAKAQDTSKVLEWVLGSGPPPDFRPPKARASAITDPAGRMTVEAPAASI